jgi:hypothetical protein
VDCAPTAEREVEMKRLRAPEFVATAIVLAVLGATAVIAQGKPDKYAVKIPDGLAMSEFKGYESWQVVSVSHPSGAGEAMAGEVLNVILGNPAMIAAYAAGIPGNGKPFPDGAKLAKIQYVPKKSTEAPFAVSIPDTLKDVAFMLKDGKKFASIGGWGYALFDYEPATDSFEPNGTGAQCGAACHTIVKSKDYVFTAYGKR